MKKLHILLTNDDGINAPGMQALYEAAYPLAKIDVVAPLWERSAVGHAITIANPLRVEKIYRNNKLFGYGVNGTPADCVKIACMAVVKKKPDLVISGINLGPNVGISVLYSGTVCGATEGAILGIPSVAVSLGCYARPDFSAAVEFLKQIIKKWTIQGLPRRLLLNINVPNMPNAKIKGIKVVRQDMGVFQETYHKRVDPRNHTYYWLAGNKIKTVNNPGLDVTALEQGYITIVPLQYDMTDYAQMAHVKKMFAHTLFPAGKKMYKGKMM